VEAIGRDSTGRMTGVLEDGADDPLLLYFEKLNGECIVDWIRAIISVLGLGVAEEPVHVDESLRDSEQLSVRTHF
jgi:hypothetical protein